MATPSIAGISPTSGPASGGDVVRLTGTGFGPGVAVDMGGACQIVALRGGSGELSVVDVRTPAHVEGVVDVELQNLDAGGQPVAGEAARLAGAYRYLRARLAREADLTRLVRTLLRELKRQIIANVSLATSLDYDDGAAGQAVVLAALPSLVLTGPIARESRVYAVNEPVIELVLGPDGPEFRRRRPAYTVDLEFRLTGASERVVELLNLMAATATFLNRNHWIEMARDPDNLGAGTVRWELDPIGEFRTALDSPDDVRAFTCGFVVRGFDVDEGLLMDSSKAVASPRVDAEALRSEGEP
jgi:hypothetical protein